MRAALEASCFRGALPPVDLRAVCLVRAIATDDNVVLMEDVDGLLWCCCVVGGSRKVAMELDANADVELRCELKEERNGSAGCEARRLSSAAVGVWARAD